MRGERVKRGEGIHTCILVCIHLVEPTHPRVEGDGGGSSGQAGYTVT